jgi:hypothetical protein
LKILAVYEDSADVTSKFTVRDVNSAYGLQDAYIAEAALNKSATYEVKYEVLHEEYDSQQVAFDAKITENLAQTPFLLKAPASSMVSSSPSIMQDPPNGNNFNEYLVPFLTKLASLGPIPTENSVTVMPFFFASRKCPSSCMIMITPKINIATTMFI